MLLAEDKKKLESYVDKLIDGLKKDTAKAKSNGVSGEQLIEKVTNMTVSKLTPESKMILSSAYNMMKEHTLAEDYFADSAHKAAFYSADILKELSKKFDFAVPSEINYEKGNTEVAKMMASGAVIVVGGIVSFTLKSWIPIGIAAVIAGIMAFVLKNNGGTSSVNNIDSIINEYYASVKKSLLAWVDSIDTYYDKAVAEIKERG